jgi:predicted nucleotidyltransferase
MNLSKILLQLIDWAANKPEIVALYLYGSQAEDHANALSDIDIGVLVQHDLPRESVWRLEDRWAAEWLEIVDLRVMNLAPVDFRFDVITRGKRVWVSDLDQVAEVESLIRRKYWDLKPLLERDWAAYLEHRAESRSETERIEYQETVEKVRAVHQRVREATETNKDPVS